MALPCGTKAKTPSASDTKPTSVRGAAAAAPRAAAGQAALPVETVANRFWRGVGFITMAAAALCIVAAVVLLPPYAKLQRVRHQRDIQATRLEEARRTREAMDRLIQNAAADEVLTRRLAWSRLGLYPARETVVVDPELPPPPPPGTLRQVELPAPPAPDTTLQAASVRLQSPSRRRGLLVLAASLLVGAVLLFGPPSMRLKPRSRLAPPEITVEAKRRDAPCA